MSAGRGQAGGGPPQNCQKVFIQRDYSEGTMVKFQTRFPTELESRVSITVIKYFSNILISIKGGIYEELLCEKSKKSIFSLNLRVHILYILLYYRIKIILKQNLY